MRIVIDLQACQSTGSRNRGIGRYSLALAQAMARHAGRHELWLLLNGMFPETISPLRELFADLVPAERIRVWRASAPVNEHDLANAWRCRAGELLREQVLAELRPDMVHVASLFEGSGDNSVTSIGALHEHLPTAATLYDLIPLVYADIYLSDPRTRNWYHRKLLSLKNADLLLAISEATRQEAMAWLQLPADRVVNISSAVDTRFQPRQYTAAMLSDMRVRYGLVRPFVMYTGGIDHRKNIDALIGAYAALPVLLRRQYQLAIVCSVQPADREKFQRMAQRAGLAEDEVIFTGFVPDDDLPMLYSDCALFVFPSWHEGFGLPALEAMACGAPVIGASTSSLPEVIGRADALFDPRSEAAITAKIAEALTDDGFRNGLRAHGLVQAKKFSWDASAKKALEAFEENHDRRQAQRMAPSSVATLRHKPRLAFVSPLPPEHSGIADYSADLLPELARYYEIELIVNQSEVSDPWLVANFPIRDWHWFDTHAERFERVLYHFGNSVLHEHMFALLVRHPGVVVLHDFSLSGILAHLEFAAATPGGWTQALYASHGYRVLLEKKRAPFPPKEVIMQYPCNSAVIERADGVIVHSDYSMQLARQWYGPGVDETWAQVPLLRRIPTSTDRAAIRRHLGFQDSDFLVCSFGLLGLTKLNHRLLQAWLNSPLAQDSSCRLVFVGDNLGGEYETRLLQLIEASGCAGRIKATGFADAEMFRNYLTAADVAVQLRTLSRGETSAAVLDCMAHGTATIINAHAAMAELSSDALIKLPDEFTDAELSEKLVELKARPAQRRELGKRAADYIRSHHAAAHIGAKYFDAIERFALSEPRARRRRTIAAIAEMESTVAPSEADLLGIASGLSAGYRTFGSKQLLIDVSGLAQSNASAVLHVDIGKMVSALIECPPHGFRVEPVVMTEHGLCYARHFTCKLLDIEIPGTQDDPVETRPGDVFVGLASDDQAIIARHALFARLRLDGVPVYFAIYDVLPAQATGATAGRELPASLRKVLPDLAETADGLVCTSALLADELSRWFGAQEYSQPPSRRLPKIGCFPIAIGTPSKGDLAGIEDQAARWKSNAGRLCDAIFQQDRPACDTADRVIECDDLRESVS